MHHPTDTADAGYRLDRDADGILTVLLDLPGKVNIMDDGFIAAMESLLARLEADRDFAGAIVSSAKPVFLAGGDLKRMSEATPARRAEFVAYFDHLKSLLRRLERLGRPLVAAINGTAVGGGYELCLACHHRIALRDPRIRIGLPEVEFGILAGAGGVVRLTRLLGFERAAPMLGRGLLFDPEAAVAQGLVDALADDAHALHAMARSWILAKPAARQRWEAPTASISPPGPRALDAELARVGDLPSDIVDAAAANLRLAAESLGMDVDAALRRETQVLVDLLATDFAQARIRAFFERRSAPVERSVGRSA